MALRVWFLLAGILFSFSFLQASEPDGYYESAYGKGGFALKTALHQIIKGHTERSYQNLWSDYQRTDLRPDGTIWDMYSNCSFTYRTDQCGSGGYQDECDCYNREHSFPKSWFNDATPMYTDLFHLYPTDGKVNGTRSNYPFGEVSNPTYTSGNGSKLGKNATAGYSGTVFEPVDEYKGDFARSYFYMATRYEDRIASWSSCPVCDGNNQASFKQWTIDLLLKWHRQDPVSQKEKDRNDAVYGIQKNRNPFIDYPELVEKIWGGDNTVFDPNSPVGPGDPDTPEDTVTYALSYEYRDAEGKTVAGSSHTLNIEVRQPAAKAAESLVLMDEDFPAGNDTVNGALATIKNTGSEYVESFANAYLYGKSAVRLGTQKKTGSVVFKEFNVNGEFSVSVSGKGWTEQEKGFTVKCEGCVQDSQSVAFTQSKEVLNALDAYEELEPLTFSVNGKVRLSLVSTAKQRVIIDRVKVQTLGGQDPDTPDNPDTPENPRLAYSIDVLYPRADARLETASVSARVALLDHTGRKVSEHSLQAVKLPDTGRYVFYSVLSLDKTAIDTNEVSFAYVTPENPGEPGNDTTVGVERVNPASFLVYPNPSTGHIVLEMPCNDNLVEIFSVRGSLVMRRRHVGERFETTLNRTGVYFVRVTNIYGGSVRRLVVR